MSIYLDNAATRPISQLTKQYLISLIDNYYNPSSLYNDGINIRNLINDVRKSVARFINAEMDSIIFTSGGSASNTLAVQSFLSSHYCLYSPISHKSILLCVKNRKNTYPLKVDRNGFLIIDNLKKHLEQSKSLHMKPFLIMDPANSEIGTIQKDMKEIIDLVHRYDGIIYLDCTGSIPSIPLNVQELDVDLCGFSAHKLGGLKGCGVLYKKLSIQLKPLIYGTQEQGLVGGTENVLGIASLGKALENYDYSSVSSRNRDYVYDYITKHIPDSYLIGGSYRLPHNLYMCFKGVDGEALMFLLDMCGIQVSTGSACNSGNFEPSHVLLAIGIDEEDIHSCIRITLNGNESKKDLDYVCEKLKECVISIRELNNNS